MAFISVDSAGFLCVRCDYQNNKGVRDLGASWDSVDKCWRLVFTAYNLEQLIDSYPEASISEDLEILSSEQLAKEERLRDIKLMSQQDSSVRFKITGLKLPAYNYQKLGVMFAVTNGAGTLIADEMGLGKTAQAIATALYLKSIGKAKSALIVTPASLKFNWPIEIEKFSNEKYIVIDGTSEERIVQWLKHDVFFYIVNYELLLEDLFGGRKFREKDNESIEAKNRRERLIIKAKQRERILLPIRQRVWDFIAADECFHADTRIVMADGSRRGISSIVKNKSDVEVLSWNETRKKIESRRICGWFRNSVRQCFRVLTDGGCSYPTGNHRFGTPRGYKTVSDIRVGDDVMFYDVCGISDLQRGILAGMMLGDGSLSGVVKKRNEGRICSRRYRLSFNHGFCQRKYATWKTKLFRGVGFRIDVVKNDGFGEMMVRCASKNVFTETDWMLFYRNGKKTVNRDWLNSMNDVGLAVWYMDDGSVRRDIPSVRWQRALSLFEIANKNRNTLIGFGRRRMIRWFASIGRSLTENDGKIICGYLKDEMFKDKYVKLKEGGYNVRFHTEGFSYDENLLISEWMKNRYGIETSIIKQKRGDKVYFYLSLGCDASKRLLEVIGKYVPRCMKYKLAGTQHHYLLPNTNELSVLPRLRVSRVHRIEPYKVPCTTYNIRVEGNHNYFAGNTLVSNCHLAKSHAARRSRCLKQLRAKFKMALTGTPMDGRLEELHSVMEFVAPGLLGSKLRFFQRHIETDIWGNVKSYKRLAEVTKKIEPFFIRRMKKDVLKDLPDKIYENRMVVLSDVEKKIYKQLAEKGHDVTADEEAIVAILRCKQFCNWPPMIDESCKETTKMDSFKEVLEEVVILNGHKVLVFSQYKEMLNIIQIVLDDMGLKYLRIDGDTGKQKRVLMQQQFNTDSSIDLMIGTEAMALGLNLIGADNVVNYDDNWSPSVMSQREDRCLAENSLVFCPLSVHDGDMGLTTIQDIRIGDHVLTHLGSTVLVTGKKDHEHRGMITTIDYRGWWEPIICTHDHKIFVKRNGSLVWIEAHDVLPSDSMVFPKFKNWERLEKVAIKDEWRLFPKHQTVCVICGKKVEARQMCYTHYRKWIEENRGKIKAGTGMCGNGRYIRLPDDIAIDDRWLRLFGWYAAEGFASLKRGKGRFVSLSGHQDEESILLEFGKTFESIGVGCSICRNKRTKGIELRAYSGELAAWFFEWFGHGAENKILPLMLQNLSPDQASVFLGGYTDGDGYYRRKQVEWVSASRTMCYQMCLLAIRSGFIPWMRMVIHPRYKTKQFIGGYTKDGKPDNMRLVDQDENYIYRPVSRVETKFDKIRVYDLSIDEEDHSFTTGFASVHNCHRLGQKNVVTVVNFICKGTIEENIRGVIYAKNKVTAKVLGDNVDELILKRMSPTQIVKLL